MGILLLYNIKNYTKFEEEKIMKNNIKSLIVEEEGQGMTEYGLALGVITIAVVGAIAVMRSSILALFNKRSNDLNLAVTML
jgi:pilus assembly protein Flp/PilA